jgi:hypothetical protein
MPVAQASVQRQILIPKASKKPEPAPVDGAESERAAALRAERVARQERLRELQLDLAALRSFNECYRRVSREQLITDGYLLAGAPIKGTRMLGAEHRTAEGNALLLKAKDVLYALLFGDAGSHTRLDRVERELLTLTLPRNKANSLAFMQAATELAAAGTWQDPESVSNDERAENVIVEVEYGEVKEEWIGEGILTALRLINHLEVNEQVLYARMINVEQSTLVD